MVDVVFFSVVELFLLNAYVGPRAPHGRVVLRWSKARPQGHAASAQTCARSSLILTGNLA